MSHAGKKAPDPSASGATQGAGEGKQYLTFNLSGEMYAVGILHVKEIIEYGQVTEIPMMPSHIRGVINLRGAVVPVIDLSARFGGAPSRIGRRSCIVIVELRDGDHRQDLGVVVDAVSAVIEIADPQIEAAPAFGTRIRTDFIEGMGKIHERFVVILNVQRVLSVEEMSQLAGTDPLAHPESETA